MSNGKIDEIDKKIEKTQVIITTTIVIATPNILNLLVFLSTIDQVILSNL